ncbi:MAG: hypothetical protein V1865_00910 [bacterium]
MAKKKTGNSVIGSVFITIILIVIFIIVIFSLIKFNAEKPVDSSDQQIIGGQRDEHGCLGPAGYSWCEASQKCLRVWEEVCNDKVFETMNKIKTETGIKFMEAGPVNFLWLVKTEQLVESLTVNGYKYVFNSGSSVQLEDIEIWFLESGWLVDEYNIADGTIGGKTGYTKDSLVCSVGHTISNHQEGEEIVGPTIQDITLECAVLLKEPLPKTTEKETRSSIPVKSIFSCETDDECIPLPSDCHPLKCINESFKDQFTKPEVCTEMFALNAAYTRGDCICINNICTNKNNL